MNWLPQKLRAAMLLGLGVLSGCAYQPGLSDNPVTRRATWFTYVEGADIRQSCQAGRDVYRLVYNGRWQEQIRTYELGQVSPTTLSVRVVEPANLARGVMLDDLMAPWRGQTADTGLSPEQLRQLVASFDASGMFAPPPVGLELPSDEFYWAAAYCRNGRYGFTAWLHPSPRFAALQFPQALASFDRTGVPVNAPRQTGNDVLDRRNPKEAGVYFSLRVAESGLFGAQPLF